jgi:aryl-alcohol dehydrogenase-like predicted oxidoreductase
MSTGRSADESQAIVQRAIDAGINFIDTAESYGTEEIVGRAVRGRARGQIVISTKKSTWSQDRPITPADLRNGLEQSLRRLGTDYVDIYHLHGLKLADHDRAVHVLVPEMLKLKDEGKIRAVGVTEAFNAGRGHEMLRRAVGDGCWDVIMVGFSILNQSARDRVLAAAIENDIGVLCMFAVRAALSQPDKLVQTVGELLRDGKLDRAHIEDDGHPLGFLVRDGAAASIIDAAYRFCRDEPGIHVVLSGTGSIEHLEANVASMHGPSLPRNTRERLVRMFDGIDTLSGQ